MFRPCQLPVAGDLAADSHQSANQSKLQKLHDTTSCLLVRSAVRSAIAAPVGPRRIVIRADNIACASKIDHSALQARSREQASRGSIWQSTTRDESRAIRGLIALKQGLLY